MLGQSVTNVDGYELSYSDASVITHSAVVTSGGGFADIVGRGLHHGPRAIRAAQAHRHDVAGSRVDDRTA